MSKRISNSDSHETPRRSGRSRKPAPDRNNIYTESSTSKRRRVNRIVLDTETCSRSIPNANCPLFKLPYEVFSQIASYLHPRDAIFLSLTSRVLYFGTLSAENSFLWYKLGDFKNLIPGQDVRWIENAHWYFMYEVSDEEKSRLTSKLCQDERRDPDDAILRLTLGRRRLPQNSPFAEYYPASQGLPPTGVSYKDMLVQTMMGDTLTGCQWCLREPLTHKVFAGWNKRVCFNCFDMNVVPLHKLRHLKLNIDTSCLQIATGRRIGGGRPRSGAWKPAVERLVRASYGPQATLNSVIQEALMKLLKRHEEREAARKKFRQKSHLKIFEYIKILWQFLATAAPASNASHQQALDDIRTMQEACWLPSNQRLISDVKLCLPAASLLPASDLKLEWFIPTADSNPHRGCLSPSQEPLFRGNDLGLGRPWMRYDMKRDPHSDWIALAAWTLIRTTISRVGSFTPAYKHFGIDEMRLAFANSFKIKWAERSTAQYPLKQGRTFQRELLLWWIGEAGCARGWVESFSGETRRTVQYWKEEFERENEGVWAKAGCELYRLGMAGDTS